MRIFWQCWLAAGLSASVAAGDPVGSLGVRLNGDQLRIAAPPLRLLSGKPLERLKNGAAVTFDLQLTLWVEAKKASRQQLRERLVVSYDLWEEKFSITSLREPRRSVSHLGAAAAEAWCLDSLALPASSISPDKPFWMRLEVRVEDGKGRADPVVGETGLSLTGLVERLSRPSRSDQASWSLEAGPLRLKDLKR